MMRNITAHDLKTARELVRVLNQQGIYVRSAQDLDAFSEAFTRGAMKLASRRNLRVANDDGALQSEIKMVNKEVLERASQSQSDFQKQLQKLYLPKFARAGLSINYTNGPFNHEKQKYQVVGEVGLMLGVEGRKLSYYELKEIVQIASNERTKELEDLKSAFQSLENITKVSNIVFGGRDRDVLDILDANSGKILKALAKILGVFEIALLLLALPEIGVIGLLAVAVIDAAIFLKWALIIKGITMLFARTNILRKAIALGAKGIAWIAEKVSGMFGSGARIASQRPSVHLQMAYVLLS